MQPLFEHRLELGGYETRALELEGDGPPLLLLHGYSDSADTWRLLLDHLGRADRRAIALDLPGFGTADRLDEREPILPQLDRFASAAVEWLDEAGTVVCGNSLGGCLALRLAEREDLGLAGVVPVAPAGLEMARWFAVIERDPCCGRFWPPLFPFPGRCSVEWSARCTSAWPSTTPAAWTRWWRRPSPRTSPTGWSRGAFSPRAGASFRSSGPRSSWIASHAPCCWCGAVTT